MGAQVLEQSGIEQRGGLGAVPDLAELPGVQREGRAAVGQRKFGAGQASGELGGDDGPAAFGPGRVGGKDRGVDSEPVQGKGAAQLG